MDLKTLRANADDCERQDRWAVPELAPLLRGAADEIERLRSILTMGRDAERSKAFGVLRSAISQRDAELGRMSSNTPDRPARRDDWHYDSQGYCDNPGRGY